MALGAAVCEELVGHVRQVDADDGEGVPETTQFVSLFTKVVQSILGHVKSEIKTTAVMQHHPFTSLFIRFA